MLPARSEIGFFFFSSLSLSLYANAIMLSGKAFGYLLSTYSFLLSAIYPRGKCGRGIREKRKREDIRRDNVCESGIGTLVYGLLVVPVMLTGI